MTKGLVALVESKTAITNLIGSGDVTRFHPRPLPQGLSTFPAASYRVNNNTGHATFDGASKYDFAFVDIWCWGDTLSEATDLWKTMRTELVDTVGTFNTIEIDHVWYMPSGAEDYSERLEKYTKQLELKIAYRR